MCMMTLATNLAQVQCVRDIFGNTQYDAWKKFSAKFSGVARMIMCLKCPNHKNCEAASQKKDFQAVCSMGEIHEVMLRWLLEHKKELKRKEREELCEVIHHCLSEHKYYLGQRLQRDPEIHETIWDFLDNYENIEEELGCFNRIIEILESPEVKNNPELQKDIVKILTSKNNTPQIMIAKLGIFLPAA